MRDYAAFEKLPPPPSYLEGDTVDKLLAKTSKKVEELYRKAIKFPWVALRDGIPKSLVIWDPSNPVKFKYAMSTSPTYSELPEVPEGWEVYDCTFRLKEWYLIIRSTECRVPEGWEDITPKLDEEWFVTILGDL